MPPSLTCHPARAQRVAGSTQSSSLKKPAIQYVADEHHHGLCEPVLRETRSVEEEPRVSELLANQSNPLATTASRPTTALQR